MIYAKKIPTRQRQVYSSGANLAPILAKLYDKADDKPIDPYLLGSLFNCNPLRVEKASARCKAVGFSDMASTYFEWLSRSKLTPTRDCEPALFYWISSETGLPYPDKRFAFYSLLFFLSIADRSMIAYDLPDYSSAFHSVIFLDLDDVQSLFITRFCRQWIINLASLGYLICDGNLVLSSEQHIPALMPTKKGSPIKVGANLTVEPVKTSKPPYARFVLAEGTSEVVTDQIELMFDAIDLCFAYVD